MNLFSQPPVIQLLVKLAIDLAVMIVLIRFIYYPRKHDKDYVFTFFVFNLLVFLVCVIMNSLEVSVGFGFGLFALFGLLRYRTVMLPIKEMTYLFTVIVIAILNALASHKMGLKSMAVANLAILGLIFFLERVWLKTQQGFKVIVYERIENIKPENSLLLMNDLRTRTGLDITEIEIERVNFLNDTATIKVYHDISGGSEGVRRIIGDDGGD